MILKTKLLLFVCLLLAVGMNAQSKYYWGTNGKLTLTENYESWIVHTKTTDGLEELSQKTSIQEVSEVMVSVHNKFVVAKVKQGTMSESDLIATLGLGRNVLDASPGHQLDDGFVIYPTHQVVFKPKSKAAIQRLNEVLDAYPHGELIQKYGVCRVEITSVNDVFDAANALYESGLVTFAHPDFYAEKTNNSDPLFPQQFQMHNTGQTIDGVTGVNDMDCNALEAWGISLGSSSITVAVIDDGVENHEDLNNSGGSSRLVGGYTPVNGGNGLPGSGDAHGQACAGIVGASHNNLGVQGVAPLVDFISVDIFAGGETSQQIADGITWAKNNGADVMSNSWGYTSCTLSFPSIDNAISDATNNGRGGLGCVIVFASGNGYKNCVDYPADNPNVIAVGAFTNQGVRSSYSNYGPTLDIVAPSNAVGSQPGAGVRTIDRMGGAGYSSGNYTTSFGGTSAACPVVSGVAALMLGYDASLTQSEVKNILYTTAIDMGPSGFDNEYANGRVNAFAALQALGGSGPTCNDGIQNGDETGIDCGGTSCPPCSSGCSDIEVTLTLNLDNYPGETTWELADANGSVIASGGPYSSAGATITEDFCLTDGCYDFTIFDSYGDGICCGYGNGSYSLTDGDGNVLASGGEFTSSETTNFCLVPPPTCDDGIQNGDETGVDCGGATCPPCSVACTDNEVTLTLNLDNYPGETTWELADANGSIIGSGGPYSSAGATITEDFCLIDGCYDFTIFDSYGDGICCGYGNGSYSLTDDSGNVLASGGSFDSSETTNFCLTSAPPVSYCASQGNNSNFEWIERIQFAGIDNTSGNNGGYADFTGQSTIVTAGGTASITLVPGFSGTTYTEYWRVWIDYNQDGDFDDAGELFGQGNGTGTLSGTLNISSSALEGPTRMRVAMKYNAYPTPCETFTYGEVEDYTVVISASLNGGANTYSQADSELKEIESETSYKPALQVFPNPTHRFLNLNYSSRLEGDVKIELFNLVGQQVQVLNLEAYEGGNTFRLEVSDLPEGAYLLRLKAGEEQYTEKVTIVK